MKIDPVIALVLSLAYALLWLPSAWYKARDFAVFRATLDAYRLLPRGWVTLAAAIVVIAEACAGFGLLLSFSRPFAAIVSAVLLGVYAMAIGINLVRGRTHLDCGCAGPAERRPVATWMVYRNALLAGLVLALTETVIERPLTLIDDFTIVTALIVTALLWLTVDRLLGQVVPRGHALKANR
jgi:uncharacterized membrane protein YphA (DoxX/SURF4 family)